MLVAKGSSTPTAKGSADYKGADPDQTPPQDPPSPPGFDTDRPFSTKKLGFGGPGASPLDSERNFEPDAGLHGPETIF